MTPDLESLSDSDLSAAVAVEVAGWKYITVYCGVDGTSWQKHVPPDGDLHSEIPSFATDANATIELLEKWYAHDPHFREIRTTFSGSMWSIYLRGGPAATSFGPPFGTAPTFARAACIALLKAKRKETGQ